MPPLPEEEGGDFHIVNGTFIKLKDVGQQYGVQAEGQEEKAEEPQPEEEKHEDQPEEEEQHENKGHTERHEGRRALRRGRESP